MKKEIRGENQDRKGTADREKEAEGEIDEEEKSERRKETEEKREEKRASIWKLHVHAYDA